MANKKTMTKDLPIILDEKILSDPHYLKLRQSWDNAWRKDVKETKGVSRRTQKRLEHLTKYAIEQLSKEKEGI